MIGPVRTRRGIIVAVSGLALGAITVLPAAADLSLTAGSGAEVTGTGGDGVNVRVEPDTGSGIVSTLPEGYVVDVIDGPVAAGDGSNWYSISAETNEGTVEGWVVAGYLGGAGSAFVTSGSGLTAPDDSDDAARGAVATVATGGDPLNLRADPWFGADVLGWLPDGVVVDVLRPVAVDDDGAGWSLVRFDGVSGYVASDYLVTEIDTVGVGAGQVEQVDDVDGSAALVTGAPVVVTGTDGDGVFVRAEPSVSGEAVWSLYDGDRGWLADGPVADDAGDDWYQIEVADAAGWVHGDYLAASTSTSDGEAIVEAATQYLGVPYLWAGTTPDGFDCSGFTWYVLSQVLGYGIERPIEDQVISGSYVAPEDLAPGDLIFFQNTYQWGLSHVGIYLGDRQFISATGQFDAVGISSLADPYWGARYLEARRIP